VSAVSERTRITTRHHEHVARPTRLFEEAPLPTTDDVHADRLVPLEAGQRVAGIDWAKDDHAVAVVDAAGRTVERFTVTRTSAGLRELARRLGRHRAGEVAIERCDGQVVETLLAAGVTVVVISPNQLKNLRGRYGQAGNKDDRFDAFVLADTLRTDRLRLRPLTPDSPATVTLRAAVRARRTWSTIGSRCATSCVRT